MLIIFCLAIALIVAVSGDTESLATAAGYILRSFYAPLTSFIYISRRTVNHTDVVSETLRSLNNEIAYVIDDQELHQLPDTVRFYNLYFVEDYDGFR